MARKEKISIKLYRPGYQIGQEVYVPEKNKITETKIISYEARVIKEGKGLVGIISNYCLDQLVSVRRGEESTFTNILKENDFYIDRGRAEVASEFIEVNADDETWLLAIGDRNAMDFDSPYCLDNCGLHSCCANISEARSIMILCRKEKGLIAHNRDILVELIKDHVDIDYGRESPLGKIFEQLRINHF